MFFRKCYMLPLKAFCMLFILCCALWMLCCQFLSLNSYLLIHNPCKISFQHLLNNPVFYNKQSPIHNNSPLSSFFFNSYYFFFINQLYSEKQWKLSTINLKKPSSVVLIVLLYNVLESNSLTRNVNAFISLIHKQFQKILYNKFPQIKTMCEGGIYSFFLSFYLYIFAAYL